MISCIFFTISITNPVKARRNTYGSYQSFESNRSDLPKASFNLDGVWRHIGALFCNWKWIKWVRLFNNKNNFFLIIIFRAGLTMPLKFFTGIYGPHPFPDLHCLSLVIFHQTKTKIRLLRLPYFMQTHFDEKNFRWRNVVIRMKSWITKRHRNVPRHLLLRCREMINALRGMCFPWTSQRKCAQYGTRQTRWTTHVSDCWIELTIIGTWRDTLHVPWHDWWCIGIDDNLNQSFIKDGINTCLPQVDLVRNSVRSSL
jgi:hypothetical protein